MENTRYILPDGLTPDDLIVHKYAVGDRMAICKHLQVEHFESIRFQRYSQNPKEKTIFIHAHCCHNSEFTTVVFKIKKP